MVLNKALLLLLFVVLMQLAPQSSSALDIDNDGYSEIYLYSASQKRVTVHSGASGELLSLIPIPPSSVAGEPVLFWGKWENTPVVFSLQINSKFSGKLTTLGANGRIKTIKLGKLAESSIIVSDLDGSGSSDILYSNAKRKVHVYNDPLTSGNKPKRLKVKMLKSDRLGLIQGEDGLKIVSFGTRRKAKAYSLLGIKSTLNVRLPKKALVYPAIGKNGMEPMSYIAFIPSKENQLSSNTYEFSDLKANNKNILKTTLPITTGHFVDTESKLPQYAQANGSSVQIFETNNTASPLKTLQLTFGGLPSPPDGQDIGGGDGGSGDNCISVLPRAEMNRAEDQYHAGDYLAFSYTVQSLFSMDLCPDIFDELTSWLENLVGDRSRSAKITSTVSILGLPIFVTAKDERLIGGCDKIRDGRDGPGGFLAKTSDHDGNFVTLAPTDFYTEEAYLVTPEKDYQIIEKLRYTGRSNPYRPTFRSSRRATQLPQHLIVKFMIGYYADYKEAWCYELTNSHVRND